MRDGIEVPVSDDGTSFYSLRVGSSIRTPRPKLGMQCLGYCLILSRGGGRSRTRSTLETAVNS